GAQVVDGVDRSVGVASDADLELADFDAHGRAGPHLVGGRHVDHGHRTLRDSSSSMRSLSTSSISGTWIFWITSLKNPRTTSWRATSSGMPRDMRQNRCSSAKRPVEEAWPPQPM